MNVRSYVLLIVAVRFFGDALYIRIGLCVRFLSRGSILTRGIDIANLSVCPSACPLRSGIR